MKVIIIGLTCLLLSSNLPAQCTLTYVGPVGGTWHNANHWNLCKIPTATDAVIIPAGKTVLINNTNATCANITVQSGGQVDRNGTGTLTVTNNSVTGTCTASCAKRVFVTSTKYGGLCDNSSPACPKYHQLGHGPSGGYSGALPFFRVVCQQIADQKGLGGVWGPWLEDYGLPPATHLGLSSFTGNFVRLDGVVVANGWADLTDGTLDAPINVDENGATVPVPAWFSDADLTTAITENYVWTGIYETGLKTTTALPHATYPNYPYNCGSWT
ncbi:MAG: hypothetical protein NZ519_12290, partial [Bacteroidia bacterium]|nr:hypothetical protein [Bacteroidia bacterium]